MLAIQREYFSILAKYFSITTGGDISSFKSGSELTIWARENARKVAPELSKALEWVYPELQKFYRAHSETISRAAKRIQGIKVVLGGQSNFGSPQLDSVRQMILYVDTVLIADPVLPWIETERKEEKFPHVNFMLNVYHLLHLRPFIEKDLEPMPVYIFQSWEKSLEKIDSTTIGQIKQFTALVISNKLGLDFTSFEEIMEYGKTHKNKLQSLIEEKRLFIAPEGSLSDNFELSVKTYKEYIQKWRSAKYLDGVSNLSDNDIALIAIQERLVPQYHLIENADDLNAHPLTSLPVQWHYYKMCNTLFSDRLLSEEFLSLRTVAEIEALSTGEFSWLTNISIESLIELREQRENESFRHELHKFTQDLHDSALQDLDNVGFEVARGLSSMLRSHQKEIEALKRKYNLKLFYTGASVAAAGVITFEPSLAPWIGDFSPLISLGKFTMDKITDILENRKATHSLIGILSSAKNK